MGPETNSERHTSYEQFVVFFAADHAFGVNIHQTREIISGTELTFMPNTPDFVSGVINLRGVIVPVIDLEKRLALKNEQDEESEEEKKIIIAEVKGNLIGMQVRDVREIIRINQDEIDDPPQITRDIDRDFVTGVGKMNDELIIFLNLSRILSADEVEELNELEVD